MDSPIRSWERYKLDGVHGFYRFTPVLEEILFEPDGSVKDMYIYVPEAKEHSGYFRVEVDKLPELGQLLVYQIGLLLAEYTDWVPYMIQRIGGLDYGIYAYSDAGPEDERAVTMLSELGTMDQDSMLSLLYIMALLGSKTPEALHRGRR